MSSNNKNPLPIAVTSRSFSKNIILRKELEEHFSNIKFNDEGLRLADSELISFLDDKVGAIIALENITESIISKLINLKVISKYGVGLNNLDLKTLEENNIKLGWSSGINKQSVAELALSFMLGISREVFTGISNTKAGKWHVQGGTQLAEKTIGIIGCGHIGKLMLDLLAPFKCRILVNDILDMSSYLKGKNIEIASKEKIYQESDIISLHIPYYEEVHHLIGEKELNKMKQNCILINTARGGIVDESALYNSLSNNSIRAAATDVFEREPLLESNLFELDNFFPTPHIGGSSSEAIIAMGRAAINNLVSNMNKINFEK